jgi:hypothetical protein
MKRFTSGSIKYNEYDYINSNITECNVIPKEVIQWLNDGLRGGILSQVSLYDDGFSFTTSFGDWNVQVQYIEDICTMNSILYDNFGSTSDFCDWQDTLYSIALNNVIRSICDDDLLLVNIKHLFDFMN